MCPDREILSVYLDGELPSPWKEKLESHLGGCARCRERLEAYRAVRRMVLDRPAAGAMEAAKERVRAGLEKRMGAAPRYRSAGVWRRHIAVPLPVAAAAAAVFVIVLALVWMRRPAVYLPESETMASEIDVRGIVPISDMDGVLQYLSGEDTGNYVILKLPESRNFTSTGEPMILKEADYRSSRQSVPVREPWRKPSR
ncbi:MAG: zf-HC2 domain-containing protein [Treponema sp.]|jgi:hypothetical protein|nr:zf-HC2 domain-containing protein [Treponema sp.]